MCLCWLILGCPLNVRHLFTKGEVIKMSSIILLLVLVVVVVVVMALLKGKAQGGGAGDDVWPFYAKKPLSQPEQILYFRLVQALPDHIILAQVQLSRLLG